MRLIASFESRNSAANCRLSLDLCIPSALVLGPSGTCRPKWILNIYVSLFLRTLVLFRLLVFSNLIYWYLLIITVHSKKRGEFLSFTDQIWMCLISKQKLSIFRCSAFNKLVLEVWTVKVASRKCCGFSKFIRILAPFFSKFGSLTVATCWGSGTNTTNSHSRGFLGSQKKNFLLDNKN